MSVTSEADECMDRGLNYIEQAINEISKVITDDAWGYDDYNNTYKERIRNSFMELVKIRDRLK